MTDDEAFAEIVRQLHASGQEAVTYRDGSTVIRPRRRRSRHPLDRGPAQVQSLTLDAAAAKRARKAAQRLAGSVGKG